MKIKLALVSVLFLGGTAFGQSYHDLDTLIENASPDGYKLGTCTAKKSFFDNQKKVRSNKRASGTGDKTKAFYSKQVAETLLSQGYNYAIITPLKISDGQEQEEGISYGFGTAVKKTFKGRKFSNYKMLCFGVDDVVASNMMWDQGLSGALTDGRGLLDIRDFISTLDLEIDAGPKRVKIDDTHFQNVGDRERVTKQIDVRVAASECRTGLAPVSFDVFKPSESARDLAAEKACLEGLRSQAVSVSWDGFPLSRTDIKSSNTARGYSINRPSPPPSKTSSYKAANRPADPAIWGEGWKDYSPSFPSMSGKIMSGKFQSGAFDDSIILLASNSMSKEDLLDRGVYISAAHILEEKPPVLGLEVLTDQRRKGLEAVRQKMSAVTDRKNAAERKLGYKRTISAPVLKSYEKRLQKRKDRIAALSQPIVVDHEDFTELAKMLKSMPAERRDLETIKKRMAEDQRQKNASDLAYAIRKLESDKSKLAAKRETYERETLELEQRMQKFDSAVASTPTERASQSEYAGRYAPAYKVLEEYSTVIILYVHRVLPTYGCKDEYLVCTDKIEAFNTLGSRLDPQGFSPITKPVGYVTYTGQ